MWLTRCFIYKKDKRRSEQGRENQIRKHKNLKQRKKKPLATTKKKHEIGNGRSSLEFIHWCSFAKVLKISNV
jgi:hypothetical protein